MRPQLCLLVLACAGPARRALHAGYVSHPRSYCGGGFKGDPHPGGDWAGHAFNVHYNRPKYVNMGYSLPRGASYFPNYYFPLKLRYTRAPHSNSPEGGRIPSYSHGAVAHPTPILGLLSGRCVAIACWRGILRGGDPPTGL